MDLFEHIWIVDRLQRLGISRYFEEEIKECLDYVHRLEKRYFNINFICIYQSSFTLMMMMINIRYWTDKGICWARCSHVQDIDDTAMAFRLLRLNGYKVSAGKK